VRGVTLQPVQDSGRKEAYDPVAHRLPLSEVRRRLYQQSTVFTPADIVPVPCDPDMVAMGYAIRDADDFTRAMLVAKHERALALSCSRPMPSPPLRAAPTDQPSPPARPDEPAGPPPSATPAAIAAAGAPPAAAATSSAPSQMSADDVTRTLASLADLRDRGAISAEEYEAKKADLLRRL